MENATVAIGYCSGCSTEKRDPNDTRVRVHHVHLNVTSAQDSIDYYEKFFGAKRVRLNGVGDALYADPVLFLLEERAHPVQETLQVGFEHAGLGVRDVRAWWDEMHAQGVQADPRNGATAEPVWIPLTPGSTPFADPEVDNFTFIYVRAPNGERIEVWSGLLRFRHMHFLTPDVDATVAWYEDLLGVAPILPMAEVGLLTTNAIDIDGVQLNFLVPVQPDRHVCRDRRSAGRPHRPLGQNLEPCSRASKH